MFTTLKTPSWEHFKDQVAVDGCVAGFDFSVKKESRDQKIYYWMSQRLFGCGPNISIKQYIVGFPPSCLSARCATQNWSSKCHLASSSSSELSVFANRKLTWWRKVIVHLTIAQFKKLRLSPISCHLRLIFFVDNLKLSNGNLTFNRPAVFPIS